MSVKSFTSRALQTLLTVGIVACIAAGPALAAPRSDAGVVSSTVPQQQALAAGEYWTPERMRRAKPLTSTLPGSPRASGPSAEATSSGAAVKIDPVPATEATAEAPEATRARETPTPLAATAVPRPYTDLPDRLNGKVFFTSAAGGNFVCSATVVNSENKSIVWTAGHCVHDGSGGQFVRNWIFVPAYSSSFNGQEPFGRWTAKELWTTTEWANNGNFRQDLGAVVLNRLNNQLIVDRIGGQGIAFNLARNQNFSSFGYPAASPFNGFDQFRCNSPRLADDFPAGVGPATIKIDCNMTGGSSGGGWLINIASNGLGYVNGLNSYRYSTTPNNLFGPYFGNEALSLYNAVRNRLA